MFADIVFMQGAEGREIVDQIERVDGVVAYGPTDESVADAIVHLSQWDQGDIPNRVYANVADVAGSRDQLTERGVDGTSYVLSWNLGLGYVSLYRRMTETSRTPVSCSECETGTYRQADGCWTCSGCGHEIVPMIDVAPHLEINERLDADGTLTVVAYA